MHTPCIRPASGEITVYFVVRKKSLDTLEFHFESKGVERSFLKSFVLLNVLNVRHTPLFGILFATYK